MKNDGTDDNGQEDPQMGDDGITPADYVQPESGGTMMAEREPHPYPPMEEDFRNAEAGGFTITQKSTPEWGSYYSFRCGCSDPHVGTVNVATVYSVALQKIVRRCPTWRAWNESREEGGET